MWCWDLWKSIHPHNHKHTQKNTHAHTQIRFQCNANSLEAYLQHEIAKNDDYLKFSG